MPAYNRDQTMLRLIKDVNDIQAALRHVTTNLPLYDIANENTPSTLVASQNNYNPGNFDILRINATSAISITGFTGGKKGRSLEIVNISAYNLTLVNESASSLAANRIKSPSGENVILYPTARVRLYYDSSQSRWLVPDPPSWEGTYGISLAISNSGAQAITGTEKLLFDTVDANEWSMWDSVNNEIVIPATGIYMGVLMGSFDASSDGSNERVSWDEVGGGTLNGQTSISFASSPTTFSCPIFRRLTAGTRLAVYASHSVGGAINFDFYSLIIARIK